MTVLILGRRIIYRLLDNIAALQIHIIDPPYNFGHKKKPILMDRLIASKWCHSFGGLINSKNNNFACYNVTTLGVGFQIKRGFEIVLSCEPLITFGS